MITENHWQSAADAGANETTKKIVDLKDRIAMAAALALVAVIGGFGVAHSDGVALGAHYYFSDSPKPAVHRQIRSCPGAPETEPSKKANRGPNSRL